MVLSGLRLTLTPAQPDDASALAPAFNGDTFFNELSGTTELTPDAVRSDILETVSMPGGAVWRITDRDATLVGVAETALIPPPSGAWIALLTIREPFQRQGFGREVADLLESHLFADPAITQIGLGVMTANMRAITFWTKRGYVAGLHRRDGQGREIVTMRLARQQR